MLKTPPQQSWLEAIEEAAKVQHLPLPPFTGRAIGERPHPKALRTDGSSRSSAAFVSQEQAQTDGIEWSLWYEQDEMPMRVAAFREPLKPTTERVTAALSLLKGWLVDRWAPDAARAAVDNHPRAPAR